MYSAAHRGKPAVFAALYSASRKIVQSRVVGQSSSQVLRRAADGVCAAARDCPVCARRPPCELVVSAGRGA
ncbi:hypothetical protein E2C01_081648 [Portunus trituberculatus]|uniref:Uncharacterized protein n=1 Tax=Portunus trituberculatus TaxID=210409 RepID=A0A5B7ISF7_PORTR|nr:hypothetical protein [Portunus trituberculatus]